MCRMYNYRYVLCRTLAGGYVLSCISYGYVLCMCMSMARGYMRVAIYNLDEAVRSGLSDATGVSSPCQCWQSTKYKSCWNLRCLVLEG